MENEKYNKWNKLKQEINSIELKEFYIKERQVWYIHNGVNVGYESNGKGVDFKRPVLVLKKVGALFFIATMTTKGKNSKFFYKLEDETFGKDSYVTLSQVKIIDKRRFFEHIGIVNVNDFVKIKNELQNILF
ncbi:MAG: type II toxin-antitoxin system PemK/MazF family toxin [Candidatus Gracilibacteria bacterium]|nr:type II toxin-antitoxin system PemK/MazF family toxin [Candidatus Gracilibacteria bacterium]